jgi:hypothetical protein
MRSLFKRSGIVIVAALAAAAASSMLVARSGSQAQSFRATKDLRTKN